MSKIKKHPTMAELHKYFEYKDGYLYRKISTATKVRVGSKAGFWASGRMYLKFKKQKYLIHRLVWIMHNGSCDLEIDHINCIQADNRVENLRPATRTQNQYNMNGPKNRTTGLKGVKRNLNSKIRPYSAQISINKKPTYLGSFATKEEAHAAYVRAAKKLHGEFYRETGKLKHE